MSKMKIAFAALAVSAGLGMSSASAMPVTDLSGATSAPAQVDQVRLVCNRWGRCWHVGGWRGYRGYGWHRHWRRW